MGGSSSRLSDVIAASALSSSNALSGKVVLITGPTSGIGYETARVLGKYGAHVILAARDSKKTEIVKDKLIKEIQIEIPHANPQFTPLALNLSSLTSVRKAAQQFLALNLPLHFLVNNAGIMAVPHAFTEDGYEIQMATNHLGHFYLTKLLLPKLRSTASAEFPCRIINLSSAGHAMVKINTPDEIESAFFTPKDKYPVGGNYGHSKLCNILYTHYLAETEFDNNILAFSVHPGVVSTELDRYSKLAKFVYALGYLFLKNANQGASTTIHTLLKANKEDNGKYFADNAVAKTSKQADNSALKDSLIQLSEG